MNKWKELNLFQKGVLLLMTVMVLVFAVLYPVTIAQVGFAYEGQILTLREENGTAVYSGTVMGETATFTVSADKTVVFQYGAKTYGPYTVKEDPTAIPETFFEMTELVTGIEIRKGEEIWFRGGATEVEGEWLLFREDGNTLSIRYADGDGTVRAETGIPVDLVEPSAWEIWALMNGPVQKHKGEGFVWFVAVFICILNAISIIFADALFRFFLSFQIRSAETAEPSDWELAGRYIGWSAVTIGALVIFMMGLQ